jgi:hypothetical protein
MKVKLWRASDGSEMVMDNADRIIIELPSCVLSIDPGSGDELRVDMECGAPENKGMNLGVRAVPARHASESGVRLILWAFEGA